MSFFSQMRQLRLKKGQITLPSLEIVTGNARYYKLNCVPLPQDPYDEVLIPSTSECDYVWR